MASVNSEQISELTHRDQDEEDSTLSLSSNGGSNLPPKVSSHTNSARYSPWIHSYFIPRD